MQSHILSPMSLTPGMQLHQLAAGRLSIAALDSQTEASQLLSLHQLCPEVLLGTICRSELNGVSGPTCCWSSMSQSAALTASGLAAAKCKLTEALQSSALREFDLQV